MNERFTATVVLKTQLQWLKTYMKAFALNGRFLHVAQFLSSAKPNDGTAIKIHTVFLAETQEVLADAMSGGGMVEGD